MNVPHRPTWVTPRDKPLVKREGSGGGEVAGTTLATLQGQPQTWSSSVSTPNEREHLRGVDEGSWSGQLAFRQ